MAVNQIFQPFDAAVQAQLSAGVQRAVAAGISAVTPQLTYAFILFIMVQGWLMMGTPWGRWDFYSGIRNMGVAGFVYILLTKGYYQSLIATPFLTDIPNWIASSINGASGEHPGAQQFDTIYSMAAHIQSIILQGTNPVFDLDTRIQAGFYIWLVGMALLIAYCVWTLASVAMALCICVGPFIVVGLIFIYTRKYALSWADTMIGLLLLDVAVIVLLSIFVGGISTYMKQQLGSPATSIDEQVQSLLQVSEFVWMCSLLAVGAPALVMRWTGGVHIFSGIPGMRG